MFVSDQVNPEGLFAVNMTKNGEKVQVLVDNQIPCTEGQSGQPMFSSANENELWVLILEKAWAKLHGSYERIIGGQAHQTLRDLTGAPGFEYETSEEDAWDKILDAEKKDFIMAAGVPAEDAEKLKAIGLVGGHSYGLIAARTVKNKDGDKVNIVNLRNPWGSFEWKGDWGDTSDCWTPELKKEVNLVEDADDGTFWMSFDDFKQHFSRVQICKYKNGYQFHSFKGNYQDSGYYLFKIDVTSKCEQTFAVSQKDERCYARNTNHEYSNCRVILVKSKNNKDLSSGLEFIRGTKGLQERDTYLECGELNKGVYFLYVQMDWFEAATPDLDSCINVNCYGKGVTLFRGDFAKRIADDKLYSKQKVLELAFKSKAEKGMADIDKTDLADKKAPLITKYTCTKAPEGYNFVIIKNQDKEQKYKECVEYTTFEGLSFIDKPDESKYELTIGPGETKIVIMESKVQGFSSAASMTTQIFHGDTALTEMCKAEGDKA